jgi:hypothetical protein
MRHKARLAALFVAIALPAAAADTPQWPPEDAVAVRMRELQSTISSPEASAAERDAARSELTRLLRSPNATGRVPHTAPRAAVEPIAPLVKPMPNPKVVTPDVATMEVIVPPKIPSITPGTGRAVIPSTGAAVDPRTGHILHETPNGYIDPRTGQFTPK